MGDYSFLVRMFLADRKPGFSHCEVLCLNTNKFICASGILPVDEYSESANTGTRKKKKKKLKLLLRQESLLNMLDFGLVLS